MLIDDIKALKAAAIAALGAKDQQALATADALTAARARINELEQQIADASTEATTLPPELGQVSAPQPAVG